MCSIEMESISKVNITFIMKTIVSFVKKLIIPKPFTKPPLGRWRIETCDKKLKNKIDLSNEDHCGPCGQYIIEKSKSRK